MMTAIAFLGKQSTEYFTLSVLNLQYYLYYLLLIEGTRKQYYNLKNHKEIPRTQEPYIPTPNQQKGCLLYSSKLCLFNQKIQSNQKYSEIILQLKITVLYLNIMLNYNLFLWLKLYFSMITAVFSVTWSSEDLCSEIFYNNSTVVLLHIFVETVTFFRILWWI